MWTVFQGPVGIGFSDRVLPDHGQNFEVLAQFFKSKKTRPALVIQNNVTNRYDMTAIVAAITSKVSVPPYPNKSNSQNDKSDGRRLQCVQPGSKELFAAARRSSSGLGSQLAP
jgi:hypothetical protein